MRSTIYLLFLSVFIATAISAQGKPYEGPDDPAGDIAAEREGKMTGNRVLIKFQNTTELADWPNFDFSKWPNDNEGVGMIDGIGLMIGAVVYLRNDSIPVTNWDEIRNSPDIDSLIYVQSSYRQGMDRDNSGTVEWGLYPVFGYFNEISETPAMSNRTGSWPPAGWPARGNSTKWPGEWNGRFGRGVKYAAQESFFVANDAHDQEYLQPNRTTKYYPRPGVFIGDKRPSVTIQKGLPWGGLGVRVEQRGFQWNNPQTRDAIFWEYNISNISDYDLLKVAFGYWLDNGIGHIGDRGEVDDIGFFDTLDDLAYSWDFDGVGIGGLRAGVMGFAFLESPGVSGDGIDNDEDGITDEKRDNQATAIVGPMDGISDLDRFLDWYNLEVDELRPHWDADEDQDWLDGDDANGNGIYDNGEFPGDDVGIDGVGPGELNYFGPDADGTEGNHRPDFVEGIGGEPNFGPLDISESDMLGLTSFKLFPHPAVTEPPFFLHDEDAWNNFGIPGLFPFFGELSNLIETFGSGPFPLFQGRTERISMCEVHSFDNLAGIEMPTEQNAPAMFQKKRIVQVIYNRDYRFAQPPFLPTLKATPGDGKVILTWDTVADKLTREPFLQGANDFEGYKIYKATDKFFADAEVLVDALGNPIGKLPIFQCDLDNEFQGFADWGEINGEEYYLGSNTGIQHFFVDENVQNGRTYYYGVVAYDPGIPVLEDVDIAPSENNVVIDLDEAEDIRFTGQNVAVVVPTPTAATYEAPFIEMDDASGIKGSGSVQAEVFDILAVKPNQSYKVKFDLATLGHCRPSANSRSQTDMLLANNGFSVYNITDGREDLVYREDPQSFLLKNLIQTNDGHWIFNPDQPLVSESFDGIRLNINPGSFPPEVDEENSGWIVGNSDIDIIPIAGSNASHFPWQYELVWTDNPNAYTTRATRTAGIQDSSGVNLIGGALLDQSFNFYIVNKMWRDENGDYEKLDIVVRDKNVNRRFDPQVDYYLAGHLHTDNQGRSRIVCTVMMIDFRNTGSPNWPQPNDVYRLDFKRPFLADDSITFTVKPPVNENADAMEASLDEIRVVPNPYVMTNALEPALSNPNLNQRRRLIFTNIPSACTIKIFSASGVFIDEIVVDNAPENGLVHWDLLTREGLEIAPGVYIFHVTAHLTDDVKMGKFAVVK